MWVKAFKSLKSFIEPVDKLVWYGFEGGLLLKGGNGSLNVSLGA